MLPSRHLRHLMRGVVAVLLALGLAACGDALEPTAPEPTPQVILFGKTAAPPDSALPPATTECTYELIDSYPDPDGEGWVYVYACDDGGGSGGGGGDDDGGTGGGGGSGGGGDTCDPTMVIGGCDDYGGGGAEVPSTVADEDIFGQAVPDCSLSQSRAWARAYCRARATPLTTERTNRTGAALNRIAGRGGICADIAAFGQQLYNAGRLRYFAPVQGDAGGWGSPEIGVIMGDYWVDRYATTRTTDGRNLEHSLVHEIEHARGIRGHVDAGGFDTINNRACAGT